MGLVGEKDDTKSQQKPIKHSSLIDGQPGYLGPDSAPVKRRSGDAESRDAAAIPDLRFYLYPEPTHHLVSFRYSKQNKTKNVERFISY